MPDLREGTDLCVFNRLLACFNRDLESLKSILDSVSCRRRLLEP